MHEKISYRPIGIIHSPFKDIEGTPIQPAGADGIQGTIEVFKEYSPGLKDLEGFSHIILVYHFHLAKEYSPEVQPFLDEAIHGLFATRSPSRPNPIGISVVRLVEVNNSMLQIEGVDIVDKTPLLDIKPYVPEFDMGTGERIGWLSGKSANALRKKADRRFATE